MKKWLQRWQDVIKVVVASLLFIAFIVVFIIGVITALTLD